MQCARKIEQWIKEGKNAVKWTRLSCHDFVDNKLRLQLFALAYNLGDFLRRLALPRSVNHWSLIPIAIGIAREVDQDRGESSHAFALHHLPDGGGCCAEATVPDDPGTDTTVATARTGAGMTVAHDETAGARGGSGDGSPAGAPHARWKGVSCTIMVRWQANAPLLSQGRACECPKPG